MGIEPTSSAWKAEVLPLNYARASQMRNYPMLFFLNSSFFKIFLPITQPFPPPKPLYLQWWRGQDSNLRRLSQQIYSLPPLTAWVPLRGHDPLFSLLEYRCQQDFQLILWCRKRELNPQPTDYKSVALPIELFRQQNQLIQLDEFS